jgi:hypothetical protein
LENFYLQFQPNLNHFSTTLYLPFEEDVHLHSIQILNPLHPTMLYDKYDSNWHCIPGEIDMCKTDKWIYQTTGDQKSSLEQISNTLYLVNSEKQNVFIKHKCPCMRQISKVAIIVKLQGQGHKVEKLKFQ